MKIGIASDHGGFVMKECLKEKLNQVDWYDYGTNSPDSVDYPEYAQKLAQGLQEGQIDRGVLICGTGIGISIAANRIGKVRAALCTNELMAKMSREHNDAQILVLGGRNTSLHNALQICESFFKTAFAGGRHQRRVDKIDSSMLASID